MNNIARERRTGCWDLNQLRKAIYKEISVFEAGQSLSAL